MFGFRCKAYSGRSMRHGTGEGGEGCLRGSRRSRSWSSAPRTRGQPGPKGRQDRPTALMEAAWKSPCTGAGTRPWSRRWRALPCGCRSRSRLCEAQSNVNLMRNFVIPFEEISCLEIKSSSMEPHFRTAVHMKPGRMFSRPTIGFSAVVTQVIQPSFG